MGKFQVLLVEDTIMLAEMVLEALKIIPEIETHLSKDGNEAVNYLNITQPDLVLLDLNLPGRSGWQVMEFMKEKYGEGNIKVIVMTAQGDSANKLVGRLQGVERYMVKPVSPQEIISTIRDVLQIEVS